MRISVALPVYNGAAFLRDALDSVLAQDHADFELVVSDNSSTDETPAILAGYARRDARVRVSRTDSLVPQAANVNRAVELCSAEWVKLFCHDDLMRRDCLSALHAVAASGASTLGLIGNGEEWMFANGFRHTPLADSGESASWNGRDFLRRMVNGRAPVALPSLTTALVRKSAWRAAGEFDSRFAHFDVFCWTRLLLNWDYAFVSSVLTTNRIHGAQVAVSARKTLRSVGDQRLFWREFVEQFGDELGLTWRARAKARLKGVAAAGTYVAVELLKRRPLGALRLFVRTPVAWWGVLPLFVVRSAVSERRRTRPYTGHVPLSMIYPD